VPVHLSSRTEDSYSPLAFDASYGVNEIVVKAHDLVKTHFPAHARNATVYGRLLAKSVIVNVDFKLTYDPEVLYTGVVLATSLYDTCFVHVPWSG
jgi:hypothetical protein